MTEKTTYKDSGVDVELADKLIGSLADKIKSTFRPEVAGKLGGFSAMFRPRWASYRDPVLVSTTDGVGTKLRIAFITGIHNTIGIDLVAMNVNDILVSGAEPLFFLDYFATGALNPEVMTAVIEGIALGCKKAGCALVGGETAEMPDFYRPGEYDLAGFCLGIVEGSEALDGSKVRPGDSVLGIASSGLHSNGYSLVRRVLLERKGYSLESSPGDLGKPLGEILLEPTTIYVNPVLDLLKTTKVHAMAHITGGGFIGNIPRVVPETCRVIIRKDSWEVPVIFRMLQKESGLNSAEMFQTFNMGVGFVVIVPAVEMDSAVASLKSSDFETWVIGEIESRPKGSGGVILV